jgi:AcrR family transcriptional regulator
MKNSQTAGSDARAYHHGDLRRALVQAALILVTEEQDWTFSLREVARRAGVSHNAPYNHFADKSDLLAAVAAAGMERLGERMQAAVAGIEDPAEALLASGLAYVQFGVENPALYRLVFGPTLAASGERPAVTREAGDRTRSVLEQIIERGAQTGAFAVSPDDPRRLAIAALTAWSAVHGLTTLVIDSLASPQIPVEVLAKGVATIVIDGLKAR